MNTKLAIAITTLLGVCANTGMYFTYNYIAQKPISKKTTIILPQLDDELAEYIFTTKERYVYSEDIIRLYEPLYTLVNEEQNKAYEKHMNKLVLHFHDVYNRCKRSIFRTKYNNLPSMQCVYVIEKMTRLLEKRCEHEHAYDLQIIRNYLVTTEEYRQEKLVQAKKKKFSPLSLLKLSFGIVKFI